MQRILAVLLFVIAFLLGAILARRDVGAQGGRYQISAASINSVYLLETATGKIWACSGGTCNELRH